MTRLLEIKTPRVFAPLLQPSRYKGAWGGRGSGKSHFFAEALVERHLLKPGMRALCIREVQQTLKESSKALIEAKIEALGVTAAFTPKVDSIAAPGGGIISFVGMQDFNAENIKSLFGYDIAWVEEAQALSKRSLMLLRPTIREEGSEIWFSWNPVRKTDAVDELLRVNPPADSIVVQANWRDNPWFPDVLEQERREDFEKRPDDYGHVWEGDYATVIDGAYYAKLLVEARNQGRICKLAVDPILPVRAYFDIGGAGAKADANAIWIVQFVGREIRLLDYIETQGQTLGYVLGQLRSRGWGEAECVLPPDGVNMNVYTGKRYEDHVREAGFRVRSVKPMGTGAEMMRVEAARRLFPQMWFDETRTEFGRDRLAGYHEKKDKTTGAGLGPAHDDCSHGSDAFGLMAVDYTPPRTSMPPPPRKRTGSAWAA